MPHPVL